MMERKTMAAFGLTMLGSACLNNIFATYYIELFCYTLDMSGWWFFTAQLIFMVWNTLNDPLFGWLSDRLAHFKRDTLQQRTAAIKYGGTIWAIAFVTVWFPPSSSAGSAQGLYFAFCLCFYDGLLTFVEVNHSALLSELTVSATDRARCNLASAGFATIGSLSSFLGHSVWDREDLAAFRRLCVVLAAIAALAFHVSAAGLIRYRSTANLMQHTESHGEHQCRQDDESGSSSHTMHSGKQQIEMTRGRHKQTPPMLTQPQPQPQPCIILLPGKKKEKRRRNKRMRNSSGSGSGSGEKRNRGENEGPRFQELVKELARSKNMAIYCAVNFLQSFDCTFEKNFFPIFLAQFAAGHLSKQTLAAIVASSFVLPWVATSGYTYTVQIHGLHATLNGVFNMRLMVAAVCAMLAPTEWPALACGLLLLNRVLSESVCRLSPLIVSDLVDEDAFVHRRKYTVAATIVGAAGTMGKVSQSLAPMVGYWLIPPAFAILSSSSRDDNDNNDNDGNNDNGDGGSEGGDSSDSSSAIMASVVMDDISDELPGAAQRRKYLGRVIVCVILMVVGTQRYLWHRFTLRGKYLKRVKASLQRGPTEGFVMVV